MRLIVLKELLKELLQCAAVVEDGGTPRSGRFIKESLAFPERSDREAVTTCG